MLAAIRRKALTAGLQLVTSKGEITLIDHADRSVVGQGDIFSIIKKIDQMSDGNDFSPLAA